MPSTWNSLAISLAFVMGCGVSGSGPEAPWDAPAPEDLVAFPADTPDPVACADTVAETHLGLDASQDTAVAPDQNLRDTDETSPLPEVDRRRPAGLETATFSLG